MTAAVASKPSKPGDLRELSAANEPAVAPSAASLVAMSLEARATQVVAAKAESIGARARLRRERWRAVGLSVLPPVLGFARLMAACGAVSTTARSLPSP